MRAQRFTTFVHKQFSGSNSPYFKFHYSCVSTVILSNPNLRSAASRKASKFLVYCNTQITKHGKNRDIKEAESIFDRMPHKNTISWTAILTAYAENGKTVKARNMFDEMPERSAASYNAMITAYIRNNCMVEEAFEMPKRNAISYAAMITGFARAGMLDKAEKLYSEMPVKRRVSKLSGYRLY